jgi:hypothetical protein
METPPNQIPETFSVEQAFVIGMLFFIHLWPLVKPRIIEEEHLKKTYSLFFVTVCSGDECCAEWNEAIRRALHIPKEEQRTLRLSLPEIFSCALEFCKLHNERYESKIAYAVQLLEAMKEDPEKYKAEWSVWQDAVEQTVNKYMNSNGFDWSDELPSWEE